MVLYGAAACFKTDFPGCLLTFCCFGYKDIINLDPVIWNLSVLPSASAPILLTDSITGSTKKCPAPIAVVAGLPTTGTPGASLTDDWCGATNSRRNDDWLVG
ncbi:MAG TPA: hypothetical protein VMW72_02975 [Sedimentisphaerales bacterium]|nr:hypothetical protein [Sedimentisphaerales bacterium]